jgi:RNase P subunit RPR2
MPISMYYRDAVLHRCEACGHQRRVAIDDLELGLMPDAFGEVQLDAVSRAQPMISMPPCQECGTIEQMSDTWRNNRDARALWNFVEGEDSWQPATTLDIDDGASTTDDDTPWAD